MYKTEILDKIYKDPSNPGSFSSQMKLLQEARLVNEEKFNLKDIKDYLKKQVSYTRHGLVPKKYIKRPVHISEGPGFLLSADLADMTEDSRAHNDNVRYLFFIIDCYSRKLWVLPLENKKATSAANCLDSFLKSIKSKYCYLWVDKGTEFFNRQTENICKKHGIKLYHVLNRCFKACYAERAIRTIKSKLFKVISKIDSTLFVLENLSFSKNLRCLNLPLLVGAVSQKRLLS